MKYGKIRPQGKVIDHWQLLYEKELTSAATTVPITSDYNVLMISGEGVDASTSVIDECGKTVTCNGNAQIDTAQKKFGVSSVLFDGTGDYLSLADSADWYFGTGDFTIDMWVRFNSIPTTAPFVTQYQDGTHYWYFEYQSNNLYFGAVNGGSTPYNGCAWSPSVNVWYHVAVVNSGGTCHLFIDGVDQTLTASQGFTNYDFASTLRIGYNQDGATYHDGWLDDIRITKGLARWTSNFTPPLVTTALINGDVDEEYRLVVMQVGGQTLQLRFNNDAGANYGRQKLYGENTTIAAFRITNDTSITVGYASSGICLAEVLMYIKSGYVRTILVSNSQEIIGTTVNDIGLTGLSWDNTSAPVAALTLTGAVSLGIGSKIILYRKVYP